VLKHATNHIQQRCPTYSKRKRETLKNKIINLYYRIFYELKSWDWNMILLGIVSIELSIYLFVTLYNKTTKIDFTKDSLELVLTINGLFSAILVTYFFNRVSWILNHKKETHDEAVKFSQKITEFRRICAKLTQYYQVWEDDKATRSLLEHGEYKHIDYYDFKRLSIGDYKSTENELELMEKLRKDSRYKEGLSDLYLGMISLVKNRKSKNSFRDSELYKDFQTKGIYNLEWVEKCVEVDYLSRLWYWFSNDYKFIHYVTLSKDSEDYIMKAFGRIDSKYKDAELNNKLMAEICDDMNEHYFKELYRLLLKLRKGLFGIDLLIFTILIASLVFGVLLPFYIYFIIDNEELKTILTKGIIGINFGILFFFVTNLYGLVKKEITWT
jgi:hypothetical protein